MAAMSWCVPCASAWLSCRASWHAAIATDLPGRADPVELRVTVRRFRRDNPASPRRTFAEDFGSQLPRSARRTTEVSTLLYYSAQERREEAIGRPNERGQVDGGGERRDGPRQRTAKPTSTLPRNAGPIDLVQTRRASEER